MKQPPISRDLVNNGSSVHKAGWFIVAKKNAHLQLLLAMSQSTIITPLSRTVLF